MRPLTLTFLLCCVSSLACPPNGLSGQYPSSFFNRGSIGLPLGAHRPINLKHPIKDSRFIYPQRPDNKHDKPEPSFRKHPHHFEKKKDHRYWHRRPNIFPFYGYISEDKSFQKGTEPNKTTVRAEPIVLNPDIFNPTPKKPLTLVIEDGVVVERYQGY